MVAARVTVYWDDVGANIIPAEQLGVRRGRSVEENLGHLAQEVQDGWNQPAQRERPAACPRVQGYWGNQACTRGLLGVEI